MNEDSLNLLFVMPAYEPAWALGGIVRCLSNLCRGLADQGHKVTVYAMNVDGQGHELDLPGGGPVEQGGVLTYFFPSTLGPKILFDSRVLVRRLKETVGNFDLVYLAAMFQWLGIATARICAEAKIPLVIGAHGGFTENSWAKGRTKKTVYWNCFLRKAFSRASAIHFTTEYERTQSSRLLMNYKSFIVPNSIDTSFYQVGKQEKGNLFRQRYGIPPDVPLLITVARADPNKRIDLLIETLVEISDLFLLVVGPQVGNLTMKWQKQAENLNVADRIIWTGYLPAEELLKVYATADIFGLISRSENFGMVVIEAMACGLPVIINADVGISEELKKIAGVMVVDQDSRAIVQALKAFLSQRPFWPLWQENCSSLPRERFAIEKVAPVMARAFADLLKGTQSPCCRWKG